MPEFSAETILLALASGALVGLLLGVFGGGGSVLAAPLLIYAVGVPSPHVAIGTSAAAVAAIALVGLVGHWRGGRVKWGCALLFAASGLLGSIIGSTIAKSISGDMLLLGFAAAMLAIGASMFRRPKFLGDPDAHLTRAVMAKLAPMGLAVGAAAGFFGIGGGFLIVPGLMAAARMPLANATASSLVSVAIFGFATAGNYALGGLIDVRLTALLLAGGAAGGLIGVALARVLSTRIALMRRMFAALIIMVALFVGWNATQRMAATPGPDAAAAEGQRQTP